MCPARHRAYVVLVATLLSVAAVSPHALASQVQFPGTKKDKESPQKNVAGQVVDRDGKGLPEAVVFLKDKKTLETQTHISDENGAYRFTGLDPNSDYELHAERKGASSQKRTVSSFDDRKNVYLVLEIDANR